MALDPVGAAANDWQAWIRAADASLKELMDYAKGIDLGIAHVGKPAPLSDDYQKILSQKELNQRAMGMALKRKAEAAAAAAAAKAGLVSPTNPAIAVPSITPVQSTIQGGGQRLDTYEV